MKLVKLSDWPYWLGIVASLGLAIWAQASGVGSTGAFITMWIVVAAALFAPVWLALTRHQANKRIAYVLPGDVRVVFDNILPLGKDEVETAFLEAVEYWSEIAEGEGYKHSAGRYLSDFWLVFKKLPFTLADQSGEFSGFTSPTSGRVYVGVAPGKHPRQSALSHELGHLVLARAGDNPSHARMEALEAKYGNK